MWQDRFFGVWISIVALGTSEAKVHGITRTRPALPEAARAPTDAERSRYAWLPLNVRIRSLEEVFSPPAGYARRPVAPASFGAWLRGLPLRPSGTPVLAYDGRLVREGDDARIAAVAELDVGSRDHQQCADSLIRLHAEYLWAAGRQREIAYRFTSGDLAAWEKYKMGLRPRVMDRAVTWVHAAVADGSRGAFRDYLDMVFRYAGTTSLARQTLRVSRDDVAGGDVFVLAGNPGHAVIVLDVAEDRTGRRVALVGQGFMPAQSFHVLSSSTGPWFSLEGEAVETPFWRPFSWASLGRL